MSRQGIFVSKLVRRKVEFACEARTVVTKEGPVSCQAGDAIVTGEHGEQWPVPQKKFAASYQPDAGVSFGENGVYRKLRGVVYAQCMIQDGEVAIGKGNVLSGRAGDWLVEFSPHDRGVVAEAIFPKSYEPVIGVPVVIGLDVGDLAFLADVEACVAALERKLDSTTMVLRVVDPSQLVPAWGFEGLWCLISASARDGYSDAIAADVLCLDVWEFIEHADSALRHALARNGSSSLARLTLAWRHILGGLKLGSQGKAHEVSSATIFAEQLVELAGFNAHFQLAAYGSWVAEPEKYLKPYDFVSYRVLLNAGVVADKKAIENQEQWQNSLLGKTKAISQRKGLEIVLFKGRMGLVRYGLSIALLFVLFSEGVDLLDALKHEANFHSLGALVLIMYLIIFLLAWRSFLGVKLYRREERHQDYRLLAECLRVQYIWSALNIDKPVANYLPVGPQTESVWVNSALRALWFYSGHARHDDITCLSHVVLAKQSFLDDQIDYLRTSLQKSREEALDAMEKWIAAGLRMAFYAFLALFFAAFIEFFWDCTEWVEAAQHVFVIAFVLGLAFWATMNRVAETYGWEAELRRCRLVVKNLEFARSQLASNPEKAKSLFFRSGVFFVRDQSAWHGLHRENAIEMPGP